MPMYGIDWPNGGGPANPGTPLEFNEITALASEFGVIAANGNRWRPTRTSPTSTKTACPTASGTATSSRSKCASRLAESLGLGVGLWHLGSEDQSIWELPGSAGGG